MRDENCKRAAAATRHSVRVLLSLLHSRCYDAQHLKSGLSTAPLLRHLHGHCVVCYTVQCWLVFVMIISVEEKRGKDSCWCALSPGLFWQNCIFNCPDVSSRQHISRLRVKTEELHYLWQTFR